MNIVLINNQPDYILEATKLLFKIYDNGKILPKDSNLQNKHKKTINNTIKDHYIPELVTFGNFPNKFFQK